METGRVVAFSRYRVDRIGIVVLASTERIHKILKEWSVERGVEMAGDRRVTSFKEFKDYWKNAAVDEYIFHASTVEFPEESDTVLQCKVTECLWAKTFRELGAAEFGKIMLCDPDFPFASTMNPKLKLERTKTLMEGYDCCDHRYIWDG